MSYVRAKLNQGYELVVWAANFFKPASKTPPSDSKENSKFVMVYNPLSQLYASFVVVEKREEPTHSIKRIIDSAPEKILDQKADAIFIANIQAAKKKLTDLINTQNQYLSAIALERLEQRIHAWDISDQKTFAHAYRFTTPILQWHADKPTETQRDLRARTQAVATTFLEKLNRIPIAEKPATAPITHKTPSH